VWGRVLDVTTIGIEDNFRALGGHSLSMLQVQTLIEASIQDRIPIAELYQHLTVRSLAGYLTQRASSEQKTGNGETPLVLLAPGGNKRPFFCVHPLGGGVSVFSELARRLSADRPFYAFQALDLVALGARNGDRESLEEIAAEYVSHVRSVDPTGPYFVGGLSFGGIVAFEMARQLASQGALVEMVALLDSRGPGWKMPNPSDEEPRTLAARSH
jgi:pimeloyl-ACP methyl ester carboxylesterase